MHYYLEVCDLEIYQLILGKCGHNHAIGCSFHGQAVLAQQAVNWGGRKEPIAVMANEKKEPYIVKSKEIIDNRYRMRMCSKTLKRTL